MAAKNWESDFRYAAIQASVAAFRDEMPDDLFESDRSFCVPIGERPVIGWTPGKTMLVVMFLGFGLLAAGVGIGTLAEDDNAPPWLMGLALLSTFTGIFSFFSVLLLDRWVVAWCMGWRGKEFLSHADSKVLTAEVSDADPANLKISIDGDDYVLIELDKPSGRLLMEGISAKYQILRSDVVRIAPFSFMNYLGAEIEYRIDDDTHLTLAIARVSMLTELINQVPIFGFLRKRIRNKILDAVCDWALQIPDGQLID